MTIASILRHKGHEVASVHPAACIRDVAILLAERRIGAVLVRDAAEQILGIVSERDIVRALAREGQECLEKAATQVMTSVLYTIAPAATTKQAMTMMTNNRIRHLPVMEHGSLIGLVSIGDIVKARLDEQSQEVDSLSAYVAGSA